jgi:hypothetical protein
MEIRLQQVGLPMSGVQIRVEPSATVSPNPLLDYSQKMGELWCYHPAGFNGYVDRAGLPIQSHPDFQEYWFRTKRFRAARTRWPVNRFGVAAIAV